MNYEDYLLDQIKSSFLNTYPKLYVVSRTCPQAFVILYNTETQSPILILTQSFAGGVIISISTPSSVTILHATQQINTKNNANLLMFSKAIFSFFLVSLANIVEDPGLYIHSPSDPDVVWTQCDVIAVPSFYTQRVWFFLRCTL